HVRLRMRKSAPVNLTHPTSLMAESAPYKFAATFLRRLPLNTRAVSCFHSGDQDCRSDSMKDPWNKPVPELVNDVQQEPTDVPISRRQNVAKESEMVRTISKSIVRTTILLAMLAGALQTTAWSQSAGTRPNRIVGLWDVQVTNSNCSTGDPLFSFKGL